MSLIDQVIAARREAEEANASLGHEAQQAAMLIAQVQEIMAGEKAPSEAPAQAPAEDQGETQT